MFNEEDFDDELDELEDILTYDEWAKEVWDEIFDVATPEEVSKAMGKPVLVKSTGKVYKNGKII